MDNSTLECIVAYRFHFKHQSLAVRLEASHGRRPSKENTWSAGGIAVEGGGRRSRLGTGR